MQERKIIMTTYQYMKSLVPPVAARPAWDALLDAFPALVHLASTPQDPYYHAEGDVWTHTKMVVEALLDSADYDSSSDDERFVLFYAALLHDIAKPSTTVIDPVSGKIGQPGHSRRGAVDIRILLWEAAVPFALREAICRIVSVHQLPFFAFSAHGSGRPPEYLVRKLSHELDLRLLAAVAEADMRGRHFEKKDNCLADIELFRELAREDGCYGMARTFPDTHTRTQYFRGANIAPDYPCYPVSGSQVTVMAGLPASGKNTWVAQQRAGLPVVSFDDAREELGLRHGANEGMVAHRAVDFAKELLRSKASFVWNATHLSSQMRKKTLDLLYAYDAQVEIVYLEQPKRTIFNRNNKRDTSLTNAAIEKMLFKWEVPLPSEANAVQYEVQE